MADRLNKSTLLSRYVGPIMWDLGGWDWTYWRDGRSPGDCARDYLAQIERAGRIRFLTGRPFTSLVAVITDTDPAPVNDFTATIDWGDGIASQGTVVSNGDGTFNVYGTHTYMVLGGFSAEVTITSSLGATAFTTTPARFWPRPDR